MLTETTRTTIGKFESLDSGYVGVDNFMYTIADGKGSTDFATVTILMLGVNDAPDAKDDSKETTPNDPVSDNVMEPNDSDPECDDRPTCGGPGNVGHSDDEQIEAESWRERGMLEHLSSSQRQYTPHSMLYRAQM